MADMADDTIGRYEFNQVIARLERLYKRVDDIDRDGTRGVGIVQAQTAELVKDIAELKLDQSRWQMAHERRHDAELTERRIGRRWLVGTAFAGLTAMAAVITMLAALLYHVKG
jgi:hypothetical protein